MPESVDAFRYLGYLRLRWRFIALTCAVAVSLALAVSLTQPKKYTAVCRILVDPPAGSDPRSAAAVSPVYLESLNTYVQFATSDTLFRRALDQFHLREHFPGQPIESLKSGILKVAMVPATKIMEIKVTLGDAKTAQALAFYLAEETSRLNQTAEQEGDQDLIQAMEKEEAEARGRMERSESEWARTTAREPIEPLQREIQNASDLKSSLELQVLRAEEDAADPQERYATSRAEAEVARKQLVQVERDLTAKADVLAKRLAERDRLDAERVASRTAYTPIKNRLDQLRGELGYRGERLQIMDPGIVPERPSAPNVPLNVFAALLLGIVAPIVYLTLQLSYQVQRGTTRRGALRVAGTRDE